MNLYKKLIALSVAMFALGVAARAEDIAWNCQQWKVIARYGEPTYGDERELVYTGNGAMTSFTFNNGGLIRIKMTATKEYSETFLGIIRDRYGDPTIVEDRGRRILVFKDDVSIVRVYNLGMGNIEAVIEERE